MNVCLYTMNPVREREGILSHVMSRHDFIVLIVYVLFLYYWHHMTSEAKWTLKNTQEGWKNSTKGKGIAWNILSSAYLAPQMVSEHH